jgi:hypothetical protein
VTDIRLARSLAEAAAPHALSPVEALCPKPASWPAVLEMVRAMCHIGGRLSHVRIKDVADATAPATGISKEGPAAQTR